MEGFPTLFNLNLFGYKIGITSSILIQWFIILFIALTGMIFTRNLKKIPDKKQTVIEIIFNTIDSLVKQNMGEDARAFIPFIGTMMIYILLMNFMGLIGVKPPTSDYSVGVGMAIISFIVVQGYAIRKSGFHNYLVAYGSPYLFLAPFNVIERVMLPVSLSLRLFGNMTAAVIVMDLAYSSLSKLSWAAQLAIPIPLHLYFDLFDGTIQMVIFVMLTMINIKIISEE